MMPNKTLSEIIHSIGATNKPAFGYKRKGKWETLSYKDYFEQAQALSNSLYQLGVRNGSKVASVTLNRPEWNVLDLALLNLGAIHVSVFPNFNIEDLLYSVDFTDSQLLFVTGGMLKKRLQQAGVTIPIFAFDKIKEETENLPSLIETGRSLETITAKVEPTDSASIYLTSGTGGKSKGVVMSHQAIVNTVEAMRNLYNITSEDRALSFAPLCVSSERSLNYYYQTNGICTYYTESMQKIVDNMQEVKPTIFLGAPALLEKIRETVFEKSHELSGFGGSIFNWALSVAPGYDLNKQSFGFKLQHLLADKLVFSKLRQIMGGRVRFIMAGGAAIPIEVMRFFWALDIPVYEGYGLSECHIISVNTAKAGVKFGTVGPLFGETEVKISSEGEILARNPYMLTGYYKDDVLTSSSFTSEGYFKTGDKGEWNGRFLKVIGRVKDIFKISTGRYISPEYVEKKINESRFIQQSIVIGFNRPYLTALIVPAFEMLKAHKPEWSKLTDRQLSERREVSELLASELKRSNREYMESERVQTFKVMEEPFSIEKGELTPSSKLKRLVIESKYENVISSLYDN